MRKRIGNKQSVVRGTRDNAEKLAHKTANGYTESIMCKGECVYESRFYYEDYERQGAV